MSAASPATAPLRVARPALATALRAAVALVLGLAITFTAGHSAQFGLVAFGIFAIATALVGALPPLGALPIARAAVALAAGIAALAATAGGAGYFVVVVSGWAIVTGAIELIEGWRARRSPRPGISPRDQLIVGGLAVLLGAALLVIPPNYSEPWQVADRQGVVQATGEVTATLMAVGVLGAWAIIHAVVLGIAAASAWRPARAES